MMAKKFEKVQEIKMYYDFLLKKLNIEKNADKIQEIQAKKDQSIDEAKKESVEESVKKIETLQHNTQVAKTEIQ